MGQCRLYGSRKAGSPHVRDQLMVPRVTKVASKLDAPAISIADLVCNISGHIGNMCSHNSPAVVRKVRLFSSGILGGFINKKTWSG